MGEEKKTSYQGVTTTLLLVAFVVLNLTKVIDWSWWWVLSPLWIPVALVLLISIAWVLIELVKYVRKNRKNWCN
jgi:phosphoglycerol transferase MdoB-like AlkP superfamily enzyme